LEASFFGWIIQGFVHWYLGLENKAANCFVKKLLAYRAKALSNYQRILPPSS
jgi:hypothetical protein